MTRKPSILFVNQHYWPDVAATGQILSDLTEFLVAEGYEVGVLCSRGGYEGGRVDAPAREIRRGVRVMRVASPGLGRRSHAGRLVDYAAFLAQVAARLASRRRWDLVVLLTTPSMLAVSGWVAERVRGQRYAIWSMDVHPEIEVALGILPGAASRLLRPLDRASHERAEFVVALGSCMKDRLLAKGIPEVLIRTIPVWSRKDELEPIDRRENALASELGIDDEFVIMYSGNAGLAHRFDEVLQAIERLERDPGFEFVFIGGGPRKPEILAGANGRRNFRYLDYQPRGELTRSLSLGDVHLLTMRGDMAGLVVPVKLYGIMAAARPVVMIGPRESDSARTIERERIGAVIDPEELGTGASEKLVETLRTMRGDPEERRAMGLRARAAFLERYERSACCASWERLIRETLST
ncbi:MAG TPA: glycosyltransferase family 4 protein [Gemmatimonadota bacterium]|nr:glycosyltransferase family 4 protein [Gemmatimonadota bacterium]